MVGEEVKTERSWPLCGRGLERRGVVSWEAGVGLVPGRGWRQQREEEMKGIGEKAKREERVCFFWFSKSHLSHVLIVSLKEMATRCHETNNRSGSTHEDSQYQTASNSSILHC